jgi:AraC-like DNA-binding protein
VPSSSKTALRSDTGTKSGLRSVSPGSLLGARGHRFHHAVEVEAPRLLAGRELAEALQPLAYVGAGGRDGEHALHEPALLAHRVFLLGTLEVAQRTGFADEDAFAKAWKRWTGQTPREFRQLTAARESGRP